MSGFALRIVMFEMMSLLSCNVILKRIDGNFQVGVIGAKEDGGSGALPIDWTKWLDDFLSRLFVLLINLEPSTSS